ncbi:Glycogen recognition site of AMP-activated protein kinase [Mucilaginibacter sp. OK098]|nr:Glycogen recognition site of AMP-activated protein kinase [Mucilaginibacter sp. OK098]
MRQGKYVFIVLVLLISSMKTAVAQSQNILFIASDHLILQIDLKSPKKELDSILKIAGVSNSIAGKVLKGDFTDISKDGWNITDRKNNIIRFDRSLTVLNDNPQSTPYQITIRIPNLEGNPGYPAEVKYGVNKYARVTVFGLSSGLTRFILPGYTSARRVFLSGSFNNWSTLRGAMKKADGGWIIDVKLNAGVHEYKYIVDGRWMTDPNNLVLVNDGAGNTNSVFYKYNYTIKLPGYPLARKVIVAGDFNKWDENELVMEKKGNIWEKQLYLNDGKHEYHFLVNGRLITDPTNSVKLKDDDGKLNSVLNIGGSVTFKLDGYKNAGKVFLAGDFNKWKPNDISLGKTIDGWVLKTTLPAGNYQYKFIVDGNWITDPANLYYAIEKGERNSFIAVKPNHSFKLKGYADAKTVAINGTFNNWEPSGFTMAHTGDAWTIDLYLKPGKYLYKLRIDNKWIIDPGNKLYEPNEFDTYNSVLWVE